MTLPLDPRTDAFDPDTRQAEEALRGRLEGGGWHYVTPTAAWAGPARLSLRRQPEARAPQVSEALPGEALDLLLRGPDGWLQVRTRHDGYLGWAREEGLSRTSPGAALLRVTALRAHAYAGPGVSQPILAELCLGSVLGCGAGEAVTERGRSWVPVALPGGGDAWVQEVVLSPLEDADPAALAGRLLGTPYVWGGRSAWGLDCSGLTQLVCGALGIALPRDADQQQVALALLDTPQRGDLAFFPGHVGVMLDERRLLHANATHMAVSVETLGEGDYGRRLARECLGYGRPGA